MTTTTVDEGNVIDFFKHQTEEQRMAFEKFAKSTMAMGVHGLLDEYRSELKLYLHSSGTLHRETGDQHPTKNRYKDVTCCDLTRVVIADGKGSDYIHANHIRGDPLQTPYIATQGPKPQSVVDFWRMVEFSHVQRIVMLCEMIELGKTKCEKYYPQTKGEEMTFGDVKIICMDVKNVDQHITRTNLRVINAEGGGRDIRHYQLHSWPDRSIPKSNRAVLRLLTYVRSLSGFPVVVHCSAGIGRTGTFIALEMCLQQLLGKGSLSTLEIAKKLRDQRAHSIQVEFQYVALSVMIIEFGVALKCITSKELIDEFHKFKDYYEQMAGGTLQTVEEPAARGPSNVITAKQIPITYAKGKKPVVHRPATVRPRRTVAVAKTQSAEK